MAKTPALALGALRVSEQPIGCSRLQLLLLCSSPVFAAAIVTSMLFLHVCGFLFCKPSRLTAPSVCVTFLLHLANSCWPLLEICV